MIVQGQVRGWEKRAGRRIAKVSKERQRRSREAAEMTNTIQRQNRGKQSDRQP
jgi:hypothetical protein